MDRPPHRWPSQAHPAPLLPPWRLPPARYQPEPHLTPRAAQAPLLRSRWRRTRAHLRLGYLRLTQRLLDRLGGLPHQRPQGPEVAALQLLVAGLLLIVLFQSMLLVLATR
jgi:hypothetical protein